MSRVKLSPEERRDNYIHARLTKEETKHLDEMAVYLDISRSEMLRVLLDYCYRRYRDYGETFD